ncbi:MAG: Uncharacterised protein [Flavobacteriaceae bacterium]|jgi:hypothetical protein|nr:MAG: Uncharacterised protein [Flavobacteriaceae bacterium]|tara:strand:+ start:367 stop:855 length:489 start_codon:yes stop_codon:yes gene_type:complete
MRKYLLLIILLQNCNNPIKVESESNYNNEDQYVRSIESDIIVREFTEEAKKITQQWTNLKELQNIINGLEKEDYSAFKEKDKYLEEFINDLTKTLPKKLNNLPITSRLLVLETNILQLESILSNSEFKPKNRTSIKNKLIESYYNFIYQINKVIEKELQIIE